MSCTAIPPALLFTQVLATLQRARERVAHGWPFIASALASGPGGTVEARLAEAKAAQATGTTVAPWVATLADCLVRVERARALWGPTPDTMPPRSSELSPCALELREHLSAARACADKQLAWEDPGKLSRQQALCVLHLAVTLAKWDAQQQHADPASPGRARAREPAASARRCPDHLGPGVASSKSPAEAGGAAQPPGPGSGGRRLF